MLKDISCLIAMSNDINDELLSYGVPEHKIARIPMGVDTSVFHPVGLPSDKSLLREKLEILDIPTVIFSGTLVRRKQPHLLIESIIELRKQGHEIQLLLVGPESQQEVEYAKGMKSLVETNGIADLVQWIGFTTEITKYYQAADIYCLPSLNEGMSASLLEAMACGLAPVVTPVSGSTDVVSHEHNGLIVDGTIQSVSKAIGSYANDLTVLVQHGERSVDLVRHGYTKEIVYRAYEDMLRRIAVGKYAAA